MLSLRAGQRISQYELVEKIGEGGMGVVWKALDTELKRHVAIKFLPRALDPESDRRVRFKREAQTAAALDHPNIAVIHEVGEHESHPFIVMQLIGGKSLRSLMQARPMPLIDWIRIGIPMAEALAYAHKHGIVHRDLKPDNVMLSAEGQPKIVDFGLAKLFNPEAFDSSDRARSVTLERDLTMVGEVFGTFAYMSPEQARGDRLDHRSDIFSLGVILYEMAGGRRPFDAANPAGTLSAIVSEAPAPLSSLVPNVHPLAESIVRKALQKDPDHRYQHADDLAADLKSFKNDIEGAQIPGASQAASARQGPRGLQALLALLTVALVGALALLSPLGTRDPGQGARGAAPLIAVVGFENLSNADDPQNLGRMLMGLVTTDLSEAGGLSVSSTAKVMAARRKIETVGGRFDASLAPDVARSVGASLMLVGQLSQTGDKLLVTAELVDVASGNALHSLTKEAASQDDLFEVAGALAESIRGHLEVPAPERAAFDLAEALTELPAAYILYEEGERAFQGQEWQGAAAAFERALSTDPSFALASYRLGMARTFIGEDEAAIEALRNGMANIDRLPARWQTIYRALLEWHEGDIHDAFLALSRLVSSAPPIPDAYYLLGEIRTHSSRHFDGARARQLFEKAREINPGFRVVNDHLLDSEIVAGDLDAARRLMDAVRLDHPEDLFLLESELKLLAAEGRWSDLVARGVEMLSARAPDGFELQTWIIDGYLHLGEWERALDLAETAGRGKTGRALASALIKRGQALAGLGRLGTALSAFRESQQMADQLVPRIREFSTQGHYYGAVLLAAAGRMDEALDEARTALGTDPVAGEWHYRVGRLLVQADRKIEAAEELGRIRAIASANLSPPVRFWEAALQAEIHLASGDPAAARKELDRILAMKVEHRDPPAEQRLRARIARSAGDEEEARRASAAFIGLPDYMPGAAVTEKTQEIFELARFEESLGEIAAARGGYSEVVDRWGAADMPMACVGGARARLAALPAPRP